MNFEITVKSYGLQASGWSWTAHWTDVSGERHEASGGEATRALAQAAAEHYADAVTSGRAMTDSYIYTPGGQS